MNSRKQLASHRILPRFSLGKNSCIPDHYEVIDTRLSLPYGSRNRAGRNVIRRYKTYETEDVPELKERLGRLSIDRIYFEDSNPANRLQISHHRRMRSHIYLRPKKKRTFHGFCWSGFRGCASRFRKRARHHWETLWAFTPMETCFPCLLPFFPGVKI